MGSHLAPQAGPPGQWPEVTDDDIIERGSARAPGPGWRLPGMLVPRWRPPRIAVIVGLAGLLAGLAAGYAVGTWHTRKAVPVSSEPSFNPQSVVPIFVSAPLTQPGPECSLQNGHDLQLGVEVSNDSVAPVTILRVAPLVPLGGLKALSLIWGPCGELPGQPPEDQALAPGNSLWFTVSFRVLVACPGPLPVQFAIGYSENGQRGATSVEGFADLSQVHYSGCS
jgi:hypothetical protein